MHLAPSSISILPILVLLVGAFFVIFLILYMLGFVPSPSQLFYKFSFKSRATSLPGQSSDQANSPSDSEILSFYTAGHLITRLARTTANGMKYSLYLTLPYNLESAYVTEDAAIEVLDLPFNTQAHLIGLSKQHGIDRVKFESFVKSNGMEKIALEGDFPDYFDIYTVQGQEVEVFEVLDPKAMEFVVDFCKAHFWEINSSEFFIAASGSDKGNDDFIETSLQFANAIKPALQPGDPGAPVVKHEVPYGEYDGPPLACPICRQSMEIHDNWQVCKAGHGVLLSGRDLTKLHDGELTIDPLPDHPEKHAQLTCPFCKHPMEETSYEESKIMIDSCTFCTFRWLDADEVAEVSQLTKKSS